MTGDYKKLKIALETNSIITEYLLVKGDISGIQNFIFNVHGSGAAKALRGKSAYINFLTLIVVHRLIDNLAIKKDSVIYVGGGNFYMIIPKLCEKDLETEKMNILTEIYEELKGDLYLNLDWIDISKNELLENISKKWKEINNKIKENGNKKWLDFINYNNEESDKFFYDKFFKIGDPKNESQICEVCKNSIEEEKLEEDKKVCKKCEDYKNLGKAIRKAEYLKILKIDKKKLEDNEIEILGYKLSFLKTDLKTKITDYTYEFNNPTSTKNLYFPTYSPTKIENGNETTKEFKDLAEDSTGAEKLGVLKLDVDNLGKIFEEQETLEKLMELSNKFKSFFEGKLNKIVQQDKYKGYIYIIYSGGDDTFILGSYDKLLEFAKELRKEFKEIFLKETFSAGILIIDYNQNVVSFANKAEESLEKAKERKVDSKKVKDGIVIFDKIFSWDEYTKLLEMKNNIKAIANAESRAILSKIMDSTKGFMSSVIEKRIHEKRKKVWRLSYYLRNCTKERAKVEDLIKIYEDLALNKENKAYSNASIIPVATRLAEFETRKEQN